MEKRQLKRVDFDESSSNNFLFIAFVTLQSHKKKLRFIFTISMTAITTFDVIVLLSVYKLTFFGVIFTNFDIRVLYFK